MDTREWTFISVAILGWSAFGSGQYKKGGGGNKTSVAGVVGQVGWRERYIQTYVRRSSLSGERGHILDRWK